MRFTIDPSGSIPIYAQLVEQVKHAIAAGTLQTGDALPSLRELALYLRISPLTIKKAYGELEALGIVATEHGRGTFVCATSDVFSDHYRHESLVQAVDRLLVEAYHLGASLEEIVALVKERRQLLEQQSEITTSKTK